MKYLNVSKSDLFLLAFQASYYLDEIFYKYFINRIGCQKLEFFLANYYLRNFGSFHVISCSESNGEKFKYLYCSHSSVDTLNYIKLFHKPNQMVQN